MLARCGRCQSTFVTERFGAQACPTCGVPVFVRDPNGPAPAPSPPGEPADPAAPRLPEIPAAPAPPAPDETRTPWERRDVLGTWTALRQTVKLAMFEPAKLFAHLRTDSADGAILYVLLVSVLPVAAMLAIGFATTDPAETREQLAAAGFDPAIADDLMDALRWLVPGFQSRTEFLALLPVWSTFWLARLFAAAGLAHLFLWIAGRAPHGWTATFKAFAYAETPALLFLVPACGGLVAPVWMSVVAIIALARTQQVTPGWAAAAVVIPPLVAGCCFSAIVGVIFGATSSSLFIYAQ